MFANKWMTNFKRAYLPTGREKRIRARKADTVAEQVKQVLQTADQKLILMVRS